MPDPDAVVAQQIDMYGEPLAMRFGRILQAYSISQARLAAVIGLSPPMLSQLMSGQRAKVSNPAVFARLVRLEELAATPAIATRDADGIAAVLNGVEASRPTSSTRLIVRTDDGPDLAEAAHALARVVDAAALARAAELVDDERLRYVLRVAATPA